MLAYIQGNITVKTPTHVVIESGGLGYFVNISLNTYTKIQDKSNCRLHTYLHIGGSLQGPITLALFGFYEEAEREIFIQLLSISGVGTATVRMVLSSLSPQEVQHAIATDNATQFERIKGIGPKTARRIILELKDKIGKHPLETEISSSPHNKLKEEALSALIMLGFSRIQSEQAVQRILAQNKKELNVEDLIKQTLKMI